jgi:elongation factor Ts
MAAITAASVKELREKTGLPMMDCKKALQESEGDVEGAIELLRKAGKKTMEKRAGRSTSSGRIAIYCDPSVPIGTIIELQCESDPVATNDKFVALANNLAKQLAIGPGAATPDELLAQASPDGSGETLKQQFDDLNNQIREVFKLNRIERIEGICGGYAHHNAASAVLLQIEGEVSELVKDISMHAAAMRPEVLHVEELDAEKVAKEREILSEAARQEGKPEKIIEKMVEGRLRNYYSEVCLAEQEFVKDNTKTVGKVAEEAGMKLVKFIHWELPKE